MTALKQRIGRPYVLRDGVRVVFVFVCLWVGWGEPAWHISIQLMTLC